MKPTPKRIKQVVELTVEDFFNYGYSTDESKKSLVNWLVNDLLLIKQIEEHNTIELSLMVLKKLNSLDVVDLEFIHNIILEDNSKSQIGISIEFDEVM
jgi:hypothetical protein